MSLEKRLEKLPDEKSARLELTPQQCNEYLDRQWTYLKALFGPILELATQVKRNSNEIANLYSANNSGTFSGAYLRFLSRPDFAGPDPTYDAGIAILLKTYANLQGISETQAGIAFLEANIFDAYDTQFHAVYKPLLSERIRKHQTQDARAS